MAQQKGANAQVLFDFEDTYGSVPGTPAALILAHNGCTVKSSRPKSQASTLTGTRNPVEPFDGNTEVSGDLTVPVDTKQFGTILTGCFGTPDTTDNGDGTYTHEFKIGDTQPSFVLEKQFTDLATAKYSRCVGCKFSSLGISVGGDGELTASLGVLGANETLESSAFDASPTAAPFERLNNFQAALTEGGASFADCTVASLDVDFGLDGDTFCIGGGGVRGAINEGILGVSGSLTALFKDASLLDKAIDSTESSLKWTITRGGHSLEIEIQELQYERNTPAVDGPAGIKTELNFMGYYTDGSEASAVVFRLTNNIASYSA